MRPCQAYDIQVLEVRDLHIYINPAEVVPSPIQSNFDKRDSLEREKAYKREKFRAF
jgi:hypothetical protein